MYSSNKTRLSGCIALFILTVGSAVAQTGSLLTLTDSRQIAAVGDILTFDGSFADYGADTVFLNALDVTINGSSGDFLLDTSPFFVNAQLYLLGGTQSDPVPLFTVSVLPTFADSFGSYGGLIVILGGMDDSSQNIIGSGSFTVSVVTPEPGGAILAISGGAVMMMCCGLRRLWSLNDNRS